MNQDLENLEQVAQQADGGAATVDESTGEEVPQGADYGIEARGAVDMFAAMVVGYAPKAEKVWTDAAKHRTAAALAPVMEKYGFSFGALPPELTLMIVAGPLLWQSSRIVAAQMAEEKAKSEPPPKVEKSAVEVAATETQPLAEKPVGQWEETPKPEVHPQVKLYQ
jgi:hypothetical protein